VLESTVRGAALNDCRGENGQVTVGQSFHLCSVVPLRFGTRRRPVNRQAVGQNKIIMLPFNLGLNDIQTDVEIFS